MNSQSILSRWLLLLAVGGNIFFVSPAKAQSITTTAFNVDIYEGDVTYETSGGATLLTAHDLGVSNELPPDLVPEIVNDPTMMLSSFAQANLPNLPGVSDYDFLSTITPTAFLDHSGTITVTPANLSDLSAAISTDLEGLLPGASVTGDTAGWVSSDQYLEIGLSPDQSREIVADITVNYWSDDIVETVPDRSSNALLLGCSLLAIGALARLPWLSPRSARSC